MRPCRRTLSLLALLPALLLVGCGDEPPPAPRIDIHVFSFDGEAPEGLEAETLSPHGEAITVYDVVRVPGGRPHEYQVPGAPDGSYRIVGPKGWWMLHLGATAPLLESGRQPGRIGLGHGYTAYVGPAGPTVRPSRRWGAERVLPSGDTEPVPVTVEKDEGGYTVGIRFPPDEWHGELQVIGHVELGAAGGRRANDRLGPLAEPFRFQASPDGRPLVTRLRQAPASPLQVVLVPADPDTQVDGLEVRALVDRLPLRIELSAPCRSGVAVFPPIPAVDRDLLLTVQGQSASHRLTPELWRRQASVRLLVVPAEMPRGQVHVVLPRSVVVDRVQVRPENAVAYGRVPFEFEEGRLSFETPLVGFTALLHAGTSWAEISAVVGDLLTGVAAFQEGVLVGGRVRDAVSGMVVRFFRHIGEEAVLGDGFELELRSAGDFEGVLPTGTYTVEVHGPHGTWRRPAPVVADSPGARLHLPLSGS